MSKIETPVNDVSPKRSSENHENDDVSPSSESNNKDSEAERLKEEANDHFKRQEFEEAADLYTQAIEMNPKNSVYFGNRSISYLKLELFGSALEDANKSIELDKNYIKGYYRRAAAFMALGKFKAALKDFETVVKVRPKDSDAKSKLTECNKICKRMAFEKAIAVDDAVIKRPISESINLDVMKLEDDYCGPRMEFSSEDPKSEIITVDFMKKMIQWFKDQKRIHRRYAYKIILDAKKIFEANDTLVQIKIDEVTPSKFTICGDIHGQYFDLLNIFNLNGLPSDDNPYLFNGDFVDRGSFSLECILTLFGFKILYPKSFFMARGNHESQTMNQMYGFEGEVKAKYTCQMYDLFAEVFNHLPLAHCINSRVLIMHGGLFSNDDVTLDDIKNTHRIRQPPDEGIMCELLWSDPMAAYGRAPSKRGVGSEYLSLVDLTH